MESAAATPISPQPPDPAQEPPTPSPSLQDVLKAFSKITDHAKRVEFYHAHPELKAVYSEGNFHRS